MKTLRKMWNHLRWLEEQRMKCAIKSGSAKKPVITKNRKDNLFNTSMSLNDIDPKIRNISPIIVSPKTNAKVSNIFTASGEGFLPNASLTSAFNTSGKKRLNNKGSI